MDFFKNIFGHHKQKQDAHHNQMPVKHNEKSKKERRSRQSVNAKSEATRKALRSDLVRKRRSRQKSIDKSGEKSTEKITEKGAEKGIEKGIEKGAEKGVEKGVIPSSNTAPMVIEGLTSVGPSTTDPMVGPVDPCKMSNEGMKVDVIYDEGKKKMEPVEEKIEKVVEVKEEKKAKYPTKKIKETMEMSTEFEVIAVPLRPAMADDDKKSKAKRRPRDQDEPVAIPIVEDQARSKVDGELEVDPTLESPPSTDPRENPAGPSEIPNATTHHD